MICTQAAHGETFLMAVKMYIILLTTDYRKTCSLDKLLECLRITDNRILVNLLADELFVIRIRELRIKTA